MRSRTVLAAALVALVLTAGCTGDDGGDDPRPTPTRSAPVTVPQLTTAWTAPVDLQTPASVDEQPRSWTTSNAIVVLGAQSLRAFTPATGTSRWTLDLRRPVCLISDAPNADGVLGLLLSSDDQSSDSSCTRAAAVDLDTGKLLWTTTLRARPAGVRGVATGPKAVAFTNTCDAAVTLSTRDGSVLARFPRGGAARNTCGDSFASDGRIVVDGREANGRGGADALIGSDAVTGRQLWTVPVTGDAAYPNPNLRLHGVVSADPPVVDAEVNGHRFLYTIDAEAGRMTPLGREGADTARPTFVHRDGTTLLVQYRASQVLFGFDLASGEQRSRTVLNGAELAIGVRDGTVLTQATVTGAKVVAGVSPGQQLVRSVDPATGLRRILGRFSPAFAGLSTVAGDTLVVSAGTTLTGLRLPTRTLSFADLPSGLRFARGELTAREIAELCVGITPETRRALGFVTPTLPVPADCDFYERVAGDASLQIYTTVNAVASTSTASATQEARGALAVAMKPDTVNGFPAMTPVSGLGDRAGIVVRSKGRPFVRIAVLRGNVVAVVDVSKSLLGSTQAPTGPLVRGARLVVADLVAEIDRRRA